VTGTDALVIILVTMRVDYDYANDNWNAHDDRHDISDDETTLILVEADSTDARLASVDSLRGTEPCVPAPEPQTRFPPAGNACRYPRTEPYLSLCLFPDGVMRGLRPCQTACA
jgi:hypothetical protein